MAIYSHSKLSTFEQCKYKYKLKYIDKIPSPIEKSIEAHLGICVHDTLEWLYKDVLKGRLPPLEEVINRYLAQWKRDYNENILIVKKDKTQKNYLDKGVQFIIDYYNKHAPFKDGTIEMEKQIFVNLLPESNHKIIGYIDRLVFNKELNRYEIHDYKTASFLPNKEKFEQDRQLALYSLGIKQLFGHDKEVILSWHYLNHNMQITSKRTNKQLNELKKNTIKLIKTIESTNSFPTQKSILCDWCEYKPYCKEYGNQLPEKYKIKQSKIE